MRLEEIIAAISAWFPSQGHRRRLTSLSQCEQKCPDAEYRHNSSPPYELQNGCGVFSRGRVIVIAEQQQTISGGADAVGRGFNQTQSEVPRRSGASGKEAGGAA